MDDIKKLLNAKMNESVLGKQIDATLVLEKAQFIFDTLFGKEYQKYVKPLYIKNKILIVQSSSSTLSQEIRLSQTKILAMIERELGKKVIERIRFVL